MTTDPNESKWPFVTMRVEAETAVGARPLPRDVRDSLLALIDRSEGAYDRGI